MKIFILITAIIELLAGVLLFFATAHLPVINATSDSEFALLQMYGAAALAIGLYCLKVWRGFDHYALRSTFFPVMSLFHVGVAIATYQVYQSGLFVDLGATGLHSLMAVLTVWFWWHNENTSS